MVLDRLAGAHVADHSAGEEGRLLGRLHDLLAEAMCCPLFTALLVAAADQPDLTWVSSRSDAADYDYVSELVNGLENLIIDVRFSSRPPVPSRRMDAPSDTRRSTCGRDPSRVQPPASPTL